MVPSSPFSHEPVSLDDEGGNRSQLDVHKLLHGVAEIASAVNEPVSLPTLLNLVATTACRLMGFDFCGVFLPDRDRAVLIVEGSHGFSPRYIAEVNALHPIVLREGATQAPSTRAFLTRRPVQVQDTQTDPAFAQWGEGAREQGFRSMIAVPLLVSGTSVGTLNGYSSRQRSFTDHEVELTGMLANQAAIAIASARLRTDQARTIHDLQVLNTTLEEQHTLAQQADVIHDRLARVALEERGVAGVAQALSDLLGRPVVVEEATGRPLARVAVGDRAVTVPPATALDDVEDRLGGDAPSRDLVDVDGDVGPLTFSAVWLGGEAVAHIWMEGASATLAPLDRRAVDYAGTILALELLRLRTAQEAEWRTTADLVRELVRGGPTAHAELVSRAERLGHDLDRPHAVLIARTDESSTERESALLGVVRSAATPVNPRPLVAAIGPFVVALWPTAAGSSPAAVADDIRRGYGRARARRGTASVAVSSTCEALPEYAAAFRFGRGLSVLARLRGRTDTTVDLGSLGPIGLLLQLEDPSELLRFADRALGPLRRHDERRGSSLVETLSVYLDHDSNTAASAAAMHVHPNTVGLRIRRIEELLGRSLTETDTVVHLGLALQADQVVSAMSA